jgi:hypothetical protein
LARPAIGGSVINAAFRRGSALAHVGCARFHRYHPVTMAAATLLRECEQMIAADFDIRDCFVSAVLLPDLEAIRRMS